MLRALLAPSILDLSPFNYSPPHIVAIVTLYWVLLEITVPKSHILEGAAWQGWAIFSCTAFHSPAPNTSWSKLLPSQSHWAVGYKKQHAPHLWQALVPHRKWFTHFLQASEGNMLQFKHRQWVILLAQANKENLCLSTVVHKNLQYDLAEIKVAKDLFWIFPIQ